MRGIFIEIDDIDTCRLVCETLKIGVLRGKQFPFRYWAAYQAIENADGLHHKQFLLDTLEECIDISCANMPTLKGKTMCLTDNSGSAWGTINSEYGYRTNILHGWTGKEIIFANEMIQFWNQIDENGHLH